ncbi:MAG: ribonuclease III [Alphaproteobacteria bacterium]|nr:ribonuclease III [Alphaproteobacteria bacterium]
MINQAEAILKEIQETPNYKKAITLAIGGKAATYEQLEFLGDRVLGLVIADILFHRFPKEKEGVWAVRFTSLVKEQTLAQIAKILKLNKALITNEEYLRKNSSVLSDVCEAVLGVIYLEKGLETVKTFVEIVWEPFLNQPILGEKDFKSRLQEWTQKNKKVIPSYEVISKKGPDHDPVFEVEVSVPDMQSKRATGASKKEAMIEAARLLLQECLDLEKEKRKNNDG